MLEDRVLFVNIHGVNTVLTLPADSDVSPEDITDLYDDVNVAATCKVVAECGPGERIAGARAEHVQAPKYTERDWGSPPKRDVPDPCPVPWDKFTLDEFVYGDSPADDAVEPCGGVLVVHHAQTRATAVRRLPAMPSDVVERLPGLTVVVRASSPDQATLDFLHQKFHGTFWGDTKVRDLENWTRAVLDALHAPCERQDPLHGHIKEFLDRNCKFDDPDSLVQVSTLEAQLLDTVYFATDPARPVLALHFSLGRRGVNVVDGAFRGIELLTSRKVLVNVPVCFNAEVSARASSYLDL